MMSENKQQDGLEVYIHPDADFVFREVFGVYVGAGEVVIEFGNYQRIDSRKVVISDRIVMTINNAYKLMRYMEDALQQAQAKMQELLKQNS